jgi:hypothetical protein
MARVINNPSGFHSRGRTAREKAAHFGAFAKEHGWTGKWSEDEESGILHLFARRGENETIDIWWIIANGAAHPDMLPIYTLSGEKIKCRNVSAAAAHAAKSEDDANERRAAARRAKPKKHAEHEHKVVKTTKYLEMHDDELERLVLGRKIKWVNSLSGDVEEAVVGGSKIKPRVIRNGHDRLDFLCDEGFRSAYLDQIVSIR